MSFAESFAPSIPLKIFVANFLRIRCLRTITSATPSPLTSAVWIW
jgi:hypothetical protein